MHSAANSRKSVDGWQSSNATSSFFPGIPSSRDCNFALKHLNRLKQSQSRLRQNRRLCCLNFHGVDVRHATSSAFKDIKVGQVPKSRGCSSEPHKLSAAWAERRLWDLVAHGHSGP